MKCRLVFSEKKIECRLLQILLGALKVKKCCINVCSLTIGMRNFSLRQWFRIIMSPTLGEGDILFLVRIPLMLASKLASASHFLLCTISNEPVVGFLPNVHGYIIGS